MILSDFLSRQKHDNSGPHDIIPISFNMHDVLHEIYYNIEDRQIFSADTIADKNKQYKATRGPQCKENLEYKNIAEKNQKITPQIKKNVEIKPILGEGRAGVNARNPK